MEARVIYPNGSAAVISGRNIASVLKKLARIGIQISQFDAIVIQMSSGFTSLDTGEKISIK